MRAFLHKSTRPRKAGFTLAELMVVLAIMTLLMSMSLAAFNSMLVSKGVEGARRTISGAIFGARMRAIKEKCEVTCAVAPMAAVEVGYVLAGSESTVIYLLDRPVRSTDDRSSIDDSAKKHWDASRFNSSKKFWAVICGGDGVTSDPEQITGSTSWTITLKRAFIHKPKDNSLVAILPPEMPLNGKGLPQIDQYKVYSDMGSGTWESLPKYVLVDGLDMPITFCPDGSAKVADYAMIKLLDTRTDSEFTWRVIVDRGSGRAWSTQIHSESKDAYAEDYLP